MISVGRIIALDSNSWRPLLLSCVLGKTSDAECLRMLEERYPILSYTIDTTVRWYSYVSFVYHIQYSGIYAVAILYY